MTIAASQIRELFNRREGVLALRPTFVPRAYPDFNRLSQRRLLRSFPTARSIPERWICSTICADNPRPLPSDVGVSILRDRVAGQAIDLAQVIGALPVETVGEQIARRFGCFNVFVKILDPGEAIPLHLHPTDAQIKRYPHRFPGQRFGKDEAYYFLDASKGPTPYTHVGLASGATIRDLVNAARRGVDAALELSPAFYQRTGSGFFLPAGVPHRPGTALTLEIQQLSDASAFLGPSAIERGAYLIDVKLSHCVGRFNGFAIEPKSQHLRGGSVETIFPAAICRKFFGDRLLVSSTVNYRKPSPLAVLVWCGRGTINGRAVRAGQEFFITSPTANRGLAVENTSHDSMLEIFTFGSVA